ncbi:MAG: hypothetical protein J2P48_16555, partial [Alphaproteobacteria bacterium]|nr:hypothetical protein [Alphaproteobacteria bacterium]
MRERNGSSRWSLVARRTLLRLTGSTVLAPNVLAHSAEGPSQAQARLQTWTSFLANQTVWGYVDKHSVVPGEGFDLMLSTGPQHDAVAGHIEFFRIGRYPPDNQKLVWTSPELTASPQPVSRCAASVGAAWIPTLRDIDTAAWPPGYYSADFVQTRTGLRDLWVAQIIVGNPRRSGRVLVRLGTNTYQAYNAWGGYSLYPTEDESQRGTVVSFDRPTSPAFFEYDAYIVRWLEGFAAKHGFEVDYAANFDVHREPDLIAGYPLVVLGAHDEYWSKEEFDAFERRIFERGGNVISFGANAAYCQVRYGDLNRPPDGADRGRLIVCYKRLSDPILRRTSSADPALLATTLFRDAARRPESMLLGNAYQSWFPPTRNNVVRYPYIVSRTDAPFFAGTGYQPGDVAAEVVGYEWDNRDPAGDGHRLWDV